MTKILILAPKIRTMELDYRNLVRICEQQKPPSAPIRERARS
jgi:hypothetical protein